MSLKVSCTHQNVLGNQKSQRKDSRTQIQPKHHARALYTEEATSRESQEGSSQGDPTYKMFTVRDSASPPFIATVELQGQKTCIEIDTGASQSIVSEETYNNFKKSTSLLTYTIFCRPDEVP